jgi:hypothetical protein
MVDENDEDFESLRLRGCYRTSCSPSLDRIAAITNRRFKSYQHQRNFKDTEVRAYGFKYMMKDFVKTVCALHASLPRLSFT